MKHSAGVAELADALDLGCSVTIFKRVPNQRHITGIHYKSLCFCCFRPDMQYVEVSRLRMSASYTRRTGLIVDAPRNDLEAVSLIVNQLIASATVPTEEIFLVDSLDDCATTTADELSWFIKQGFCTSELDPIKGHVRPFYLRFPEGS
jgi:hypothetical protein